MVKLILSIVTWLWMTACQLSEAGPVRDWISKHPPVQHYRADNTIVPSGIRLIKDMPYGKNRKQTMDIYLPNLAKNAPIIFMVHGGAWRIGDKAAKSVVEKQSGQVGKQRVYFYID